MGRIPDKDNYEKYVKPETVTEETPSDNNDNKEEK